MLPSLPRALRGLPIFVALLLVANVSWAEDGAASSSAPPSFHPDGLNSVVQMAVLEAYRRMADARCQQLFSDFGDALNRPLAEKLESIGQTGQSYLGWIWFVDAGFDGPCEQSHVVAFTSPGSQVVRFCSDRFTRAIRQRGIGFLAAIIIHEELHSLGLSEDPPSSDEITRRVESRCGS